MFASQGRKFSFQLVLAALAACLLHATAPSVLAGDASDRPHRFVRVTGSATVWVQPDEVDVRFEVHSFDRELAKAKSANDSAAAKVLEFLRSLGVEDKHVQTERFRADAVYEPFQGERGGHGPGRGELRGYSVGRAYLVRMKDVTQLDALSERLLTDPAVTIGYHQFRSSRLREQRDEARAKALQAARQKASAMAAELGCELGAPVTIEEGQPVQPWGNPRFANVAFDAAQASQPPGGAEVPVQLGQIEITADVTVTFELKLPG